MRMNPALGSSASALKTAHGQHFLSPSAVGLSGNRLKEIIDRSSSGAACIQILYVQSVYHELLLLLSNNQIETDCCTGGSGQSANRADGAPVGSPPSCSEPRFQRSGHTLQRHGLTTSGTRYSVYCLGTTYNYYMLVSTAITTSTQYSEISNSRYEVGRYST